MSKEKPGVPRKIAMGFGFGLSNRYPELKNESPLTRLGVGFAQFGAPALLQYGLALHERGIDWETAEPKHKITATALAVGDLTVTCLGFVFPGALAARALWVPVNASSYWVGQKFANLTTRDSR